MSTSPSFKVFPCTFIWYLTALVRGRWSDVREIKVTSVGRTYKLMDPRWIGIKGALATRSPSGANRAQEKSKRSLMFVLIAVCCSDRPMASATLMKRFANRVSKIGSGPFFSFSARFEGVPGMVTRCLGVSASRIWWSLYLEASATVPKDSESLGKDNE